MIWNTPSMLNRLNFVLPKRSIFKTTRYAESVQPKRTEYNDQSIREGAEVEGFRVTQVVNVPDFNSKLIRLNHVGTGAQYAHIERDDSNNAFAIAFRTTPFDSTGLPHVLEHLVLFGSEKYPCRDPFFKMLNRSLATYINAQTWPDQTMYPFATQNYTDYYNLLSVYLDAVFKPKLRPNDFKVEGWRLEHEDVLDAKSPITLKGVVFNEMKGVYSENQSIFMESILNNVLPSHTYAVNSGGNPLEIPNLTHRQLVSFHDDHYHPSNARMYSYGNFSLVNHLQFVNDRYLRYFDAQPEYALKTAIPSEPRWSEPRRKHVFGRFDPLAAERDKQSILGVAYLCDDIRSIEELFAVKIVAQLLTDGPNAPFYRSLVEPNIGTGYAPCTGFDAFTRDTTFVVGLQGIHENDFEKIEQLVYETFDGVAEKGFDDANVQNVLHGAELSIRNQTADFGLSLLYNIAAVWNHDGDVGKTLMYSDNIGTFRKNYEQDSRYLQRLVEKYFKNNTHRLVLTMSPDVHHEEKQKLKEEELLKSKLAELKKIELEEIYKTGVQIRKEQEAPDDSSCLPSLKVTDISKEIDYNKLDVLPSVPVQTCKLPTNGITYFRVALGTADVPEELKSLLPLFAEVAPLMGTAKYDYRAFDQLVYRKTAGLHISTHVAESIDSDAFEEKLVLGSFCLDRNVKDMFDLWSTLFNELALTDLDRFTTLVRNIAGDLVNGVADSGHLYAMLSASSLVSAYARRAEQFGGLTYIKYMKEIANQEDLSDTLDKLKTISQIILNKKRIRCAVNFSPENTNAVYGVEQFLSQIPGDYVGAETSDLTVQRVNSQGHHYILPFANNYVAKSVPTVPYAHVDFAKLRILCKLLTTKYLLPLVRERSGAYGAGVKISTGGTAQFYSYRDPNTINTVNTFDEAAEWVLKNEFSDSDIDEAKLGVFRDIDAPTTPSDKGMRTFLNGITDSMFAEHRLQLLKVNRNDLLSVASKYLKETPVSGNVILGPETEGTSSWKKVYSE